MLLAEEILIAQLTHGQKTTADNKILIIVFQPTNFD